ncbi:FecR family protein [Oricola thermophila]|uniref:FecR domain-containing protein n=1 Tax=Oricola thermophila TaxID=2742145 RepID=A0A6N1V8C6_9HYPH|nr:FecR domain-containing protein [Oricola thermophila]QKV17164.1 FecR domain-containing protein [Oricola thermophila]
MRAGNTIALFAAAVLAATALPQTAYARNVGVMTAEKAMITRGDARVTEGTPIALGDRLAANATGSGVIVFDDESSARMGPNAVLTVDEFVYDPARRNGAIRLRQTSGLARIFGGQISKRGKSEVRTPHIVLGVRGGIVDVAVENGRSIATLRGGLMVCRAGGKKRTVTNPGMSCVSDGRELSILRIAGNGRQLVTPASRGGGTSPGSGREFDGAHCASGAASVFCRSRDGGLPRPGTSTGSGIQTSGPSGGNNYYRQ